MLKCRILCQKPTLQDVVHSSTIYQIGTSVFLDELDERGNFKNVIKEISSRNDKERYEIDLDLENVSEDTVLYARTKFVFSKNGNIIPTNWSRTITLMPNIKKLSMSDVIIQTPSVNIESDRNQIFIKSSDFELYSGLGTHHKSGYKLSNTDNEIITIREEDEDNLNSIYIENKLSSGKIYKADVSHSTETTKSHAGSSLISTYSQVKELVGFEAAEAFVINRKWYYRVKIYTNNFRDYDLQIRDVTGNVIYDVYGCKDLTGCLCPSDEKFQIGQPYDIFIKLNFADNKKTKYGFVYSMFCGSNENFIYDPTLEYKDKYNMLKDRKFMSDTITIERETFDGKFISYDHESKSLCLLNTDTSQTKVMDFYKFPDNITIGYLNSIQLSNHDILVDVVEYSNNNTVTKFLLFEYDTIKTSIKLKAMLARPREKLNTAISNSLVSTNEGRVFYIPARYLDEDGVETKLPLIELCIDTIHTPVTTKKYFLTVDTDDIKGKVFSIIDHTTELDTYKELLELVKEYYKRWCSKEALVSNNKIFSAIANKVQYEFMLGEIQRINELQELNIITEEDRLNRDKILKKLSILKLEEEVPAKDEVSLSLKEYTLPFFSKFNASLFLDKYSDLYTYGGSYAQYNTKEVVDVNHGTITVGTEEYFHLDNKYIHKFDKTTNTYKEYSLMPEILPEDVYNLHSFLRADGKIVFFNATHSGSSIGFEQFLIFDPTEFRDGNDFNRWTYKSINGEMSIPFRSMKIYQNGVVERLTNTMQTLISDTKKNDSSRKLRDEGDPETSDSVPVGGLLNKDVIIDGVLTTIKDPKVYVGKYLTNITTQKVLRYSPFDTNVPRFDLGLESLGTLIVNDNEVITIEDIYKYRSYNILGTGVLRWKRPQGITELYSTDWIVTHDDVNNPISSGNLSNKKYESILILDGVRLKVLDRN